MAISEEDLEEEYEGEKWDRVLMFIEKHPSLLVKLIPAGNKKKSKSKSPRQPTTSSVKARL